MNSISACDIARVVAESLANHRYVAPASGTTVGVPWSVKKEVAYIELLKQSLVPPRLEFFVLEETYDQIRSNPPIRAEYWVVAEHDGFVEWYDPTTNEFGLGQPSAKGAGFVSIGVRGDLIGVFCAM